jgi:hypothetical protein
VDQAVNAPRWVWAGAVVSALLLQGCPAGFAQVKLLSESPAVMPEDDGLHDMIAGVRLGVIDGRASQYLEQYLAREFSKKMGEEKVFKQVHYPIEGNESVIFEVGATSPRRNVGTADHEAKVVLCAVTLFLACFPVTQQYDFDLEVRAIGWPVGTPIGRYRSNGRVQVEFGLMRELEAKKKGPDEAMMSAFNQVINGIIQDRAKYLAVLPAPSAPAPVEGGGTR